MPQQATQTLAGTWGSSLGGPLSQIFGCDEILPGDVPSYNTCKQIMAYHPLGAKMTDSPITLAQSQRRRITVQKGPEERLVEAFNAEWENLRCDENILNLGRLARGYGIASIALLSEGTPPGRPLDKKSLYDARIGFNVYDPLNTAGSLVLNQDPLSIDFQKVVGIAVNGQPFHRSRTVTLMNERPLYIEYTSSAYGFVGRSVFQRVLFPMKSYINSMVADDLVEVKVGVLVAKMKPGGSIADRIQFLAQGVKRNFVKEAVNGNVIGITPEEEIASLNFTNFAPPHALARKNILDNIATGADMPAIILNQETFAEGFGEGTEDAKRVAQFVNSVRTWLWPAYHWMDDIVQHRAWNPEFYRLIQKEFPEEYGRKGYTQAYYEWVNSFNAIWPSFIEEPESERIKVDDVKLKAVIAAFQVLEPVIGEPQAKGELISWVQDCFNERKDLFPSPLNLDVDAIADFLDEQQQNMQAMQEQGMEEGGEPKAAPPFSARDSVADARREARVAKAVADLTEATGRLPPAKVFTALRRKEAA